MGLLCNAIILILKGKNVVSHCMMNLKMNAGIACVSMLDGAIRANLVSNVYLKTFVALLRLQVLAFTAL